MSDMDILAKVKKVAQDLRAEAAKYVDHDAGLGTYDTTTAAWEAQMVTADIILRTIRDA